MWVWATPLVKLIYPTILSPADLIARHENDLNSSFTVTQYSFFSIENLLESTTVIKLMCLVHYTLPRGIYFRNCYLTTSSAVETTTIGSEIIR